MPYLPEGPGYKAMDTSLEAARAVAPKVKQSREEIIAVLKRRGPMTADEAAGALDMPILHVRPRFSELKQAGAIAPTGERRRTSSGANATVWRAV